MPAQAALRMRLAGVGWSAGEGGGGGGGGGAGSTVKTPPLTLSVTLDPKPWTLDASRGNSLPLGPYSRIVPRALWLSQGGGAVSYERGNPVSLALYPKP